MTTITGPTNVAPLADHHRFRFIVLDDDDDIIPYLDKKFGASAAV